MDRNLFFLNMEYLDNIVNHLNDMLSDDKQMKYPDYKYATAHGDFGDMEVEVWLDSSVAEVHILRDNGREYPNIEQYISDRIVDYDSIEVRNDDVWNAHGFRSEADYIKYKYG